MALPKGVAAFAVPKLEPKGVAGVDFGCDDAACDAEAPNMKTPVFAEGVEKRFPPCDDENGAAAELSPRDFGGAENGKAGTFNPVAATEASALFELMLCTEKAGVVSEETAGADSDENAGADGNDNAGADCVTFP